MCIRDRINLMSEEIIFQNEENVHRKIEPVVSRPHHQNPVISYLASLNSKDSRRVQKTALDQIASALSNGDVYKRQVSTLFGRQGGYSLFLCH